MSIFKWATEPKKIYYWEPIIVSDMQWPCPDGFHVPLKSEWEALVSAFNSLWISWNQAVSSALKLPLCWYRSPDASRWSTSPTSRIWTSSGYTWDYSYYIKVYSNSFSIDTVTKATGCAIRPFKDSPKAPDSSRAVLYQWTWNAWVYHNSELWLISISSDWTNWITIADKNLWATTVYNYWDTYSQANCGNSYQRWNNYWFTYQWTVTTSTTQVNASTYWPWNYYESSTFIKRTSSPYKWDSSDNANLWWWVTQWTSEKPKEVKAVYLWENKVRPSLPDYLCFTAEQANSTIRLYKSWSDTSVSLETSSDWQTWSDYTINTTITLTNIGDKIYWRNKSETVTNFSTLSTYYTFVFSWLVWASWDIDFLLCKNSTDTIPSNYCFRRLFYSANSSLTMPPKLPATTLTTSCYETMFRGCAALAWIPKLPATTLKQNCYYQMFYGCSKIKLSSSQTGDYTQGYRIPTEWTWTTASNDRYQMFTNTWWTFTSAPNLNRDYYLHKDNTIVG